LRSAPMNHSRCAICCEKRLAGMKVVTSVVEHQQSTSATGTSNLCTHLSDQNDESVPTQHLPLPPLLPHPLVSFSLTKDLVQSERNRVETVEKLYHDNNTLRQQLSDALRCEFDIKAWTGLDPADFEHLCHFVTPRLVTTSSPLLSAVWTLVIAAEGCSASCLAVKLENVARTPCCVTLCPST